ncbi:hypothetical protein ABI59_23635 [Acidobacteria bacterium Mor1]|nr:hypothetical protein ABI59_23635 [Acidobacteria bacterium Mor1]
MNRFWTMASGLFLAVLCGCAPPEPAGPTGVWQAEPEFQGAAGRVVLEILEDEEGQLGARLGMPDLGVHGLAMGPATLQGSELQAGPFRLTFDPAAGTLKGDLPEALVPVHRIAATFRRVASAAPVPEQEPEAPPLEPAWTYDAGAAIWGGVAADDSGVYFGDDSGMVRSLDLDGTERWRFAAEGAVRGRPSFAGDDLLVLSDDGRLYRLDRSNGETVWVAEVEAPRTRIAYGESGYRYDHQSAAPVIAAGAIYLGTASGALLALDAASGRIRWQFEAGDSITGNAAVADGVVCFGSFDGFVYALDTADGALRWKVDTGAPVPSSPAIHDGLAIVGSRSYDLFGLALEDGAIRWRSYLWFSWIESSVIIDGGAAYLGSSDAQLLQAFDPSSGARRWSADTGGSAWATPAVDGEVVYIGTAGVAGYMVDHRARFLALDREQGRVLGAFSLEPRGDEPVWGFSSSPAAARGRVFVGGLDGRLYAFDRP